MDMIAAWGTLGGVLVGVLVLWLLVRRRKRVPDPVEVAQANEDDWAEERAALHQQIGELKQLVANMKMARSEEDVVKLALGAAKQIEDMFARSAGSRSERLSQVTVVIKHVLQLALAGEKTWPRTGEISGLIAKLEAE